MELQELMNLLNDVMYDASAGKRVVSGHVMNIRHHFYHIKRMEGTR